MVKKEILTYISEQFSLMPEQEGQFEQLFSLYPEWNAKINVISRKDIDNFGKHHLLHSLAIGKLISFKPGTAILDLGTGGGLPGIPLAILFPHLDFFLIDARRKKIKVVRNIAERLGLQNVQSRHTRVEDLSGKLKFDFIIARAVASLGTLLSWSRRHISDDSRNALPNGMLFYKGGNISAELKTIPTGKYFETTEIKAFFDFDYFSEKYILYIQN